MRLEPTTDSTLGNVSSRVSLRLGAASVQHCLPVCVVWVGVLPGTLGISASVMATLVPSDVGSRLLSRARAVGGAEHEDQILPMSRTFPFLCG